MFFNFYGYARNVRTKKELEIYKQRTRGITR